MKSIGLVHFIYLISMILITVNWTKYIKIIMSKIMNYSQISETE